MAPLQADYLERVYAGVLGKLIGVYVGRPFEGWTHQRILAELGPVKHYVHERLGLPLVVTDDDLSGTFAFVRALEEHGVSPDLTAEDVGRTWLNNVVERRSVFWWGGRGVSTEHTAWLNLSEGVWAPRSGSIAQNGRTVAEQIGAQIFIDGWALVAPGRPELAAKLAKAAGSVSHDGESVYAAVLWAAMEAEAFVSKNVDHLLDTGLQYIPAESDIARMIGQVRAWCKEDGEWAKTRQRIEDTHGYDKYHGVCHVMPNHAIMVMALIYGGHSFHEAMHIINTCGWDTDCNSGNIGCLVAIMHGLSTFEGGPDWRGPLADRALISSADGGYSINDAARIAIDVANLGYQLAGEPPLKAPKDGAQFHFSLPGSVQGFQSTGSSAKVEQGSDDQGTSGLAIRIQGLTGSSNPVEALTQTFSPREVERMGPTYPLMCSPLVYPGQKVFANVKTEGKGGPVKVQLRLKHYSENDELMSHDGTSVELVPGTAQRMEWTIPDTLDSQPIQQLGLAVSTTGDPFEGTVWLESLGWSGIPRTVFRRPAAKECKYWHDAWVTSVDDFHMRMIPSFHIVKNSGEGQISIGTREWADYKFTVHKLKVTFGNWAGAIVRTRGLHRYYGVILSKDAKGNSCLSVVKARDEHRRVLASIPFDWGIDAEYEMAVAVQGNKIRAEVGSASIEASDKDGPYLSGGMGLVVQTGSLSADSLEVSPIEI
ncbi:uncharacterized protein E0L32_001672 [Thyridium curvatum]|uniref:ADP-ribosylglycohydrolase n=1 Tax=Thyridium curvatum TaxID=1093900 RepID=A0A507AQU6_9PEZI|nr:uncharacterized protein E0L32_001526 [Thyridium curvatum]XP_030990923.1 uncharacterized protein E0L32_001672 [Thyridium curvatum]TPX09066.1 hypothetical protein E0L32_001526 [Thyridium curvatum]TPX09212.1 hypothetical protein E0L32_001672 [Thyridium curvatum]